MIPQEVSSAAAAMLPPELTEEQDYQFNRLADAGGYSYGEALEAVLGRDEHYGRVVELTLSDTDIVEAVRSFVEEGRARETASADAERTQREIAALEDAFNSTRDGAGFNAYMVREKAGLN